MSTDPPAAGMAAEAAVRRAAIREWLEGLMARHAVKPAEIARRARVNQSTIYRILSPESAHTPTLDSIARIAEAFGEPLPGSARDIPPRGFSEGDVAPYDGPPPPGFGALKPSQSVWKTGNRALELAGILPDDLLLLDQAADARAGDTVVAQIYDFESAEARTRIRLYDGLYLTTATMDRASAERPLPVDGERVVVMGRIIALSRILS